MTDYLVKFSRNWADEFDVYGFKVMTSDEWDNFQSKMKSKTSFDFWFGTNEGWEEENGADFLKSYKTVLLDPNESVVLRTIFPNGFGVFPFPVNDDEESDEWD